MPYIVRSSRFLVCSTLRVYCKVLVGVIISPPPLFFFFFQICHGCIYLSIYRIYQCYGVRAELSWWYCVSFILRDFPRRPWMSGGNRRRRRRRRRARLIGAAIHKREKKRRRGLHSLCSRDAPVLCVCSTCSIVGCVLYSRPALLQV